MSTCQTDSGLPPISIASITIGFISFAITIATFLSVFWSNLSTLRSAPTEIDDYLGNLKQGLFEERWHLRRVRKRRKRNTSSSGTVDEKSRSEVVKENNDDLAVRVSSETLKHMIHEFKDLERPFLRPQDLESRERRGGRDEWNDMFGRRLSAPEASEGEAVDFYRTNYWRCGFKERWEWLNRKNTALTMLEALQRIETRRVAREIGMVSK